MVKSVSQHQPSKEYFPGGSRVTVKVYNKEKTSREQTLFATRCKQGQIRLCRKTSKKPDHFCKSIRWTAEIKINRYQND